MNKNNISKILSIILMTFQSVSAWAEDRDNLNVAEYNDDYIDVEKIIVYGRGKEQIGTAKSASEGVVGYADFNMRPMLRVGELVEVIPGMVATQHSGSGKANQYFLRGFNLDHGTDFLASLEGMPINLPTHGHGQGYLDLNFIIPEVVETVTYRKGPYSSEVGDFSSAGSTTFKIYDSLDDNFAEMGIGQNGYFRIVSANSIKVMEGDLLIAAEGQLNDGPWVLDDDLRKYNSIVKYSRDYDSVRASFIAAAYQSSWNSTDQVPNRAVRSGLIDEMGFIDDNLGGNTTRFSFLGKVESENIKTNFYGQYYDFNLFSNFTYFLDDPLNGDEFEQVDTRSIWGGDISYQDDLSVKNVDLDWKIGTSLRYDHITDLGLFKTNSRIRHDTVRNDKVDELALGAYGEVKLYLSENFRLIGGLRIDRYSYDVNAFRAVNSGKGNASILSPKFSASYRLHEKIETYLNYGHGFHSNDVRGASISVDPVAGTPVSPVPVFAKSKGGEIGIRIEPKKDINFTVAGFWLDLSSELVFVGDAGTTEVNDASRRYGIELAGFWKPKEWLAFDITAATTDAKFKLGSGQQNAIPGSVRGVMAAGAMVILENGIKGSIRMRHIGSAPLTEDASVRSDPSTLLNMGVSYEFSAYTIDLDIFNVLNSNSKDISYYYGSRLKGEQSPVDDLHYHPVEPFTVRLALKIKY